VSTDREPEPVLVPGGRRVRASHDRAGPDADALVVVCPPDPRQGGDRRDPRLIALGEALADRGIDALRIDYADATATDADRVADAERALGWARGRVARVGLAGYSLGAAVAAVAARSAPDALGLLAPPATLDGAAVPDALAGLDAPVTVVVGREDRTVEWRPVARRARAVGAEVVALPADHGFVGGRKRAVETLADGLAAALAPDPD
jgi:alpha/beta superfamily hydrolase